MRVLSHIDPAAMKWSKRNDDIISTPCPRGVRVQVLDRRSNVIVVEYVVRHCIWESIRTDIPQVRAQPESDESDQDPIPTPQKSTSEPASDSDSEQPNTKSRASIAVSPRKSQPAVLPQQQSSLKPARVLWSKAMVGDHAPRTRRTSSSSQKQAQQGDDDLMILDEAPKSCRQSQSKVKQEIVTMKKEPVVVLVRFLF